MRAVLPLVLGAILFVVGRHYSGLAAGAFMGTVGVVMGWVLGKLLRGRAVQQAPPPPEALPGESPVLHGPISLLRPQGTPQEAWAYLSDQRLSLRPLHEGLGVDLSLAELEEIRPQKKSWRSGRLSLVFKGQTWRLQVPDARRWEQALRAAARKER